MQSSFWLKNTGGMIALGTFLFSWMLFSYETSMLLKSFFAALMTAGLVWISYVMISWLVMSFKGQ